MIILKYDECQLEAIKSIKNTLVIAGAGSGKTTTIIGKVKYLLKNNIYKPDEILIISFTNETVNSLKNKISDNVEIKTFHKLALDIINCKKKEVTIVNDNYLAYIINEYFNSYALYNRKTFNIYRLIMKNKNIEALKILIETYINIYKSNYSDIQNLYHFYKINFFINKIYYKFILDIYLIYQRELESTCSLDLNDLIIRATKLIENKQRKTSYKYIIVDEFQDTSQIRFNLINCIIAQNKGTFFVVGDDYQSIYRFSGCNLDLFINFTKKIPETKLITLNHNYRNSTKLINIANNFIMKNKKQLKKQSICHKDLDNSIKIVFYVDKKTIINKVLKMIKGNIIILGRYNQDKKKFNIKENENIRFLTIHKSKGIEEDNIILVNLVNSNFGFPSKINNEKILSQVLKTDYVIYEEERRLFYVALTRARKFVYLLAPKDNYSVFIKELIKDYKSNIEIIRIN